MNVRHQVRTVDLAAFRENLRLIGGTLPPGVQLMAVVKADAYGHGLIPVAREALRAGADQLAVALAEEGAALRHAGVTAPILVLGAVSPDEAAYGVAHNLTMTVCSPDMVRNVQAAAEAAGKIGFVHLKIDSGMCRIGARTAAEVSAIQAELERSPSVRLTGAFTHFADADGAEENFTLRQFARFQELTAQLPAGITRHCANSAAIHRYPQMALDMVRAGISMYGYPPVPAALPLRPCMAWRTRVTYVKEVSPGDTVSYGRTFTADRPLRIATIACGYGDGYHRAASGQAEVLIRGRRARVVGRICMDQMMADVTHIPGVIPGDTVTLLGTDGDETITAEDMAAWAGTISYEVLLAATGRVDRVWLHEGE